ncbi:hypothetical protein A2837_01895 [Candidatus Kaiserbacteria bacterium RIFCSPHIGHO2_01_FULL_46_22]|uniref:Uncharacterized protein n=1 Tax=Candidatus Kaiserbacteria bacterium RIFCSPHIGHO2_01_FULL_46_22 TaxID=1798475 RepID=A0A1F6BYB4_9BACT|nr:MAG: hypothetical protein A2837_01895 [Candidatus Kaiserbacteria bacterium RIFCSPHIGHO2_01_FULL_46_22]
MFFSFLYFAWEILWMPRQTVEEKILTTLYGSRELTAYQIIKEIRAGPSTTYPVLQRLEENKIISSRWSYPLNPYTNKPRGRLYRINT